MGIQKLLNIGSINYQFNLLGKIHSFIRHAIITLIFFKMFKAVYELEANFLPYNIQQILLTSCHACSSV
jgi:hypothetical protein